MKKQSNGGTVPAQDTRNTKSGGVSPEALKSMGRNAARAALQKGSKK